MRRDEEDLVTPARVDGVGATCAPGGGGPQCLRNEKLSFPPAGSCRLRAMPTISRGPTSLRSGPDFEATWNVTRAYECDLCSGGWHLTSQRTDYGLE